MALPPAVQALWDDLQAARAEVLKELEGLTQAQADWKPGDKDWSIGLILDHLKLAEIASGKLTTKLIREAEAAGRLLPYPSAAAVPDFIRLPSPIVSGPVEAPPHIWPQGPCPIGDLLAELRSTRERSRLSIDRLGSVDPQSLKWTHVAFGEVNLAHAWSIILVHDKMLLQQIRTIKASPGFPER